MKRPLALLLFCGLLYSSQAWSLQDALLVPVGRGDRSENLVRERLQGLTKADALKFISSVEAATQTLTGQRELQVRVLRSFEILRRRSDFDTEVASKLLSSFRYFEESDSKRRLELLLLASLAKKDAVTFKTRVEEEFKNVTSQAIPSEVRLSLVAALTDAMAEASLQPTLSQFESLLKSDVGDIRVHGVMWFGISPLENLSERVRFFKLALNTKPYQARAKAYGIISKLKPAEIRTLEKAGAFQISICKKETDPRFAEVCKAIERATGGVAERRPDQPLDKSGAAL